MKRLRRLSPTAINARKTHCIHGHPLSGDNLKLVRQGRCRACRTCIRRWSAAREGRASPQKLEDRRAARALNPFPDRANAANTRFGEKVHWTVLARLACLPCFNCGRTPAGYSDHVIPLKYGGRNLVENLQPSCKPCNQRKSFLPAPKTEGRRRWAA